MRILIKSKEGQEPILPKVKGKTLSMTTKEAQYFLLGYTSKTTDGKLVKLHPSLGKDK